MSAGKSEVPRYSPSGYDRGMSAENEGRYVEHSDYAALESLLLDARATGLKLMGDLQRAEALAGEYERDARRYRIWRDRSNPQTDALRIEAADLYGDDLDAAIDAVGGRGE